MSTNVKYCKILRKAYCGLSSCSFAFDVKHIFSDNDDNNDGGSLRNAFGLTTLILSLKSCIFTKQNQTPVF